MPVTNLVWLTSLSDKFTAENTAAMAAAYDAQADWVARNVPSAPSSREERGVALFQQLEDPRVAMETAHWSSPAEHGQWLASAEYKASSAPLGGHFDFSKLEYFHLDTDAMRPVPVGSGLESLMASPVISVSRTKIPVEKKDEVLRAWEKGLKALEELVSPRIVRTGMRIQREDPGTDELVAIVGWADEEGHGAVEKLPGYAEYSKLLKDIAKGFEVKHYKRIL